jgi:type I restriction enzyme S subunit
MNSIELEKICIIKNGYAFKSEEYKSIGVPLLRISNFNDGDVYIDENTIFVDSQYLKSKSDFIVEKGDILIALSGATTGKYGFYNFDYPSLLNQRIGLLKSGASQKLYDRYFYFYLTILKSDILRNAGGAAQPNISTKTIGKFQIPLPPLTTQKRIAAILDAADLYRQTTKALVAKYDQLAQSLFLEMFGDPVRNRENWKTKKLEDVCLKITDGTHFSPEPQSEGFPYVTAKHVKEYGLDFDSKPTFICEEAHNEIYKRCTPEFGDILYIKDGATTGIACINTFNKPISLLSSLALLKLNSEELNSYYLCYWLNHKGIKEKLLNEYMSGAAIQRYTLTKINSFIITVPPISLQTQFATRIQLIEAQKQLALAVLQKSETLFNSLLQKAFKGELVS